MNDDHLITAVKESVTDVHMDIPAEQIVRRGQALRARRRVPVLAGGLAVVAGAVLAMNTLLPTGHQPSGPATTRLAAWTVTRQSGGAIHVTIRELRDPAGLQRTLRADGLPASVTFLGHPNPACHPYAGGGGTRNQRVHTLRRVYTVHPGASNVMVLHPSGLPPGAGVLMAAGFRHSTAAGGRSIALTLGLVQASLGCTGG